MRNDVKLEVSLSDADSYFATRLRSDAWDAANDETRIKALAQASFLISGAFVFSDAAYSIDDEDAVTWHDRVIAAVCEEALWLLSRDPAQLPDALFQGVSSASAGSVSATFDKSFVLPWICPVAKTLIGALGTLIDDDTSYVRSTPLAI